MPLIMENMITGRDFEAAVSNRSAALAAGHQAKAPESLVVSVPNLPHTTLHVQITRLETSNMIFLTTSDDSSSNSPSSLGSFVYSMPNVSSMRRSLVVKIR